MFRSNSLLLAMAAYSDSASMRSSRTREGIQSAWRWVILTMAPQSGMDHVFAQARSSPGLQGVGVTRCQDAWRAAVSLDRKASVYNAAVDCGDSDAESPVTA